MIQVDSRAQVKVIYFRSIERDTEKTNGLLLVPLQEVPDSSWHVLSLQGLQTAHELSIP